MFVALFGVTALIIGVSVAVFDKSEPEMIMFTTTGHAGEYWGQMFGVYRQEGWMNGAKFYRQLDRNNIGAYCYRFKNENANGTSFIWYVGSKRDGPIHGALRSVVESETVPMQGWQFKSNHEWHTDNGTKVEIVSNEKVAGFCRPTNITISGKARRTRSYVAGVYTSTGKWSAGRQIFKHSKNPLYLFLKTDQTHWGVRASIDSNDGDNYKYAKIVSGSAPDMCPYSPKAAHIERENRTCWAYYGVNKIWKCSEDISVIAVSFVRLENNSTNG